MVEMERKSRNGKQAAVITLSDKGYAGEREDKSGALVKEMLEKAGYEVKNVMILPDDRERIERELIRLSDESKVELIMTTGGTGFSPRDCTPEATLAVADRNAPGIAEAMRWMSFQSTPRAMLGRGVSVIRGETLIVNLPGSPKAVRENLEGVLPFLEHGLDILTGKAGECGNGGEK